MTRGFRAPEQPEQSPGRRACGMGGAGRVQSGERESPAPLSNLNFFCKVVEDPLKDFKVPQWDLL